MSASVQRATWMSRSRHRVSFSAPNRCWGAPPPSPGTVNAKGRPSCSGPQAVTGCLGRGGRRAARANGPALHRTNDDAPCVV
eukprot:CAMPEP_0204333026 /NCGR_PEP_ID=MMETSP0469-20131031/16906_1 /ASSEMBLY_ACC=CAM_ASM_000384 /TAXON_ID=2969 /ORGANISM="Oxyrrhis marina" /LENGTH=81 /DNA_ID=CAMNT_0051316285 /DNA_START=430 /DNA_END=675 /DNA_ORIENTATION=+